MDGARERWNFHRPVGETTLLKLYVEIKKNPRKIKLRDLRKPDPEMKNKPVLSSSPVLKNKPSLKKVDIPKQTENSNNGTIPIEVSKNPGRQLIQHLMNLKSAVRTRNIPFLPLQTKWASVFLEKYQGDTDSAEYKELSTLIPEAKKIIDETSE